ncbi:MAG: uracil-DNA glycosylase family protein [Anaerolineaceae bacterium]|nr:MAG: uracil-DNA glycosylase family protein [Anaerolineaceae bacterium]
MESIASIRKAIMEDPNNLEFTKKGWNPIFMANPQSKLLIIGQAPGIKTQEKSQSFMDKSGNKLREWLGVTEDIFYNSGKIAVLPLDFYFPGKGKTGDLPPRKDFAPKWHPMLINKMPQIELTLLIGSYAQKFYLKGRMKQNLTETVKAYQEYLPEYFPLVHPSPLNIRWFKKNPEFEEIIVPQLQSIVKSILY